MELRKWRDAENLAAAETKLEAHAVLPVPERLISEEKSPMHGMPRLQ